MKNRFKRSFNTKRIKKKFFIPYTFESLCFKWGWKFRVSRNKDGNLVVFHPNSIHAYAYGRVENVLIIEFKQFMDQNTDMEDVFMNPLLRCRMNTMDRKICFKHIKNGKLIKPTYLA